MGFLLLGWHQKLAHFKSWGVKGCSEALSVGVGPGGQLDLPCGRSDWIGPFNWESSGRYLFKSFLWDCSDCPDKDGPTSCLEGETLAVHFWRPGNQSGVLSVQ